ncbi:tRNA (5-methylaminomethyl-2-thiouridylate)-methyltransferase [Tindallia californiensis]|uniref:tRNA-specific 2-thiouridylase MnmA n=2 Tax=Tindallia californiensis TaxID=159292 RepID=A0A1H3NHU4_9FIRM|nr:tRNA (5-methylaminomethyl-2-thiouridylate)-methyltransferase [Tindallia californiensis]
MMEKKVLLGMSGGVDSSVAAHLLKQEGYQVIGVTMQIWPEEKEETNQPDNSCCSLSAVEDARRVANHLDIPFYVMNFKDYFQEKVIDYFVDEYRNGRTPNPCIACNRYVKFEELLRKALQLNCDYVATGHYATIEKEEKTGRYVLKKSVTETKDQTYALYNMTQFQLQHTLMPLGKYHKEDIRELAKTLQLPVADKAESQEICFVSDNNYGRFIEEYQQQKSEEGSFIDHHGKVVGTHKGIIHYTIGQRRGLHLALGYPAYVTKINPTTNTVHVGPLEKLFSKGLIAKDLNFIPFETLREDMNATVKIRYNAKDVPATLYRIQPDKVKVIFETPQRAVTAGQSVVFYDNQVVVGGGMIMHPID